MSVHPRPYWVLAVPLAAIGLWAGYRAAHAASLPPGLFGVAEEALYFGLLILLLASVVIVLLLVAVIRAVRRIGGMTAFAAAAILALSTVVGFQIGANQFDAYHPPVVLHAGATASVDLLGVSGFVSGQDGTASCDSVKDSTNVDMVSVLDAGDLDIGELGPVTLWAFLSLGAGGAPATITLTVGSGDLPENYGLVTWRGAAVLHDTTPAGASGSATFQGVPFGGRPSDDAPPPDFYQTWPAALSGTLQWRCQGWQ